MGPKFKAKRKKLRITLYELAGMAGTSGATLSRFERGLCDVPLDVAVKAAKALGMRLVLL